MPYVPAAPSISVVICTRDRPDSIVGTLRSIATQDYADFEVLVVDQSRGDETREIVEEASSSAPTHRYLRQETPGLSRAYNTGVREARSDLLAFTDDDVVAPRDWLSRVARAFADHPQVSLVYGQVLVPPELLAQERVHGVTPTLPISERRVLDRRHGFRVFGMGANFAARRELFQRVGGFDEVLGGGGPLESSQDFDFMYRVFKAGESTLLEPDVRVYHYGFRSSVEWPATISSYGIGVGGFCLKHVRMGDLHAAWLLCGFLAWTSVRLVKRLVTLRPAGEQWAFLRNILAGMGRSLRFPVDRRLGLYRARP